MAALTTGCVGQSGLVERDHLDQFRKFDPLDHQLRDPIATPDGNRRGRVKIDQRHLDLAAVPGINGARAVDNRKSNARSQTGSRVNQTHHAVRNSHRDAGGHQRPLTRGQFDVMGAEQVNAGVTLVGSARHRQIAV